MDFSLVIKQFNVHVFVLLDLEFVFLQQPSSVSAIAGFPLTLHCRPPASYPAPNITWYKDGSQFIERNSSDPFPVEMLTTGDLFWTNFQLMDAGVYNCIASNNVYFNAVRTSNAAVVTIQGLNNELYVLIEWHYLHNSRQTPHRNFAVTVAFRQHGALTPLHHVIQICFAQCVTC
jgi:Immunoglobulin domain